MKLKEFIKTSLIRAGANVSDEELSNMDLELPETVKPLMNMQLAKADKDLKAHFFQLFAKNTEAQIAKIVEDSGLEVSLIDKDGKQLGVNDQIKALLSAIENKLKESESNKKEEQKNSDWQSKEAELQKKIAELSKKLAEQSKSFEAEKASIHSDYAAKLLDSTINFELSKLQYKPELGEDGVMLAKLKLQNYLQSNKAKLVKVDNGIKVVQADNSEIEYFDSNGAVVKFDDIVKHVTGSLVHAGKTTTQVQMPQQQPIATPNVITGSTIPLTAEQIRELQAKMIQSKVIK